MELCGMLSFDKPDTDELRTFRSKNNWIIMPRWIRQAENLCKSFAGFLQHQRHVASNTLRDADASKLCENVSDEGRQIVSN